MIQIGTDIWVEQQNLILVGVNFGSRMTVVRLESGDLWLCSPIKPTPELLTSLSHLGKIGYIVAPNAFHHLFVSHYEPFAPGAKYYGSIGLEKKRKDLKFDVYMKASNQNHWPLEFDSCFIEGHGAKEIVFFHKTSKTIIVADAFFNMRPTKNIWQRVLTTLIGVNGLRVSRYGKTLITDRQTYRRSLEKILSWDAENIVLAHGDLVIGNAKPKIRNSLEFLKTL